MVISAFITRLSIRGNYHINIVGYIMPCRETEKKEDNEKEGQELANRIS
jgi:hypothetical protein